MNDKNINGTLAPDISDFNYLRNTKDPAIKSDEKVNIKPAFDLI